MPEKWDPVRAKAQLRLAAQRLGQLQDRKDSEAQITRRDIATLLQAHNVPLAREKGLNLRREDVACKLLEILEMHCGILLEQFAELEASEQKLNPAVVESSSSIIFAAPQTGSRDLAAVRDMLVARLGPDFARSAINNKDGHVSPRVLRAMNPSALAADLDDYLLSIARTYNVNWRPGLGYYEKLNALSEILDPASSVTIVDIARLRQISATGIPDQPPWLRPRIWKLLLGILPPHKRQWVSEARQRRDTYYDLLRRLFPPVAQRPRPSTPLDSADSDLLNIVKTLTGVPSNLFAGLEVEPEHSHLYSLQDSESSDVAIEFAHALDARVARVREATSRKEAVETTPEIRLALPDGDDVDERSSDGGSTTLHLSQVFRAGEAHHKHASALLRLLFVHSSLHPANRSPHLASLLVPLYAVVNREVEPSEVAHAEADTFWMFQAMVGEIAELEEEEGVNLWMRRFSERLAGTDEQLFADLHLKSLNPSLPHYSYRWLAAVLTHTLPLSAVLVVWDALFSQPPQSQTSNAKLEYLLDVCTGMLIQLRIPLLRLGKLDRRSPSLWDNNTSAGSQSDDAFMEGITLLQVYPIADVGGVERLLQVAADIAYRRQYQTANQKTSNATLGEKLRQTIWRGITNQVSPEPSPVDHTFSENSSQEEPESSGDDAADTAPTGFASRLRTTVWKGITNQSAMEPPPSPVSPRSSAAPSPQPSPRSPQADLSPQHSPGPSLWSFASKLKESDAAAKLSKASTNLTAKAMGAWQARADTPAEPSASHLSPVAPRPSKPLTARVTSLSLATPSKQQEESRRGSLPIIDRSDAYSPPARPAFFRPPRDSWMLQPQKGPLISSPTPSSPESTSSQPSVSLSESALDTVQDLQASLSAWTGLKNPAPKPPSKSGPRPLLLNPTSLITATPQPNITRSATNTPTPQWSDGPRDSARLPRRHAGHSSISSTSTVSSTRTSRVDDRVGWDSDTSTSRVIRLNRGGVSPMAPSFRVPRHRDSSNSSFSGGDPMSPSYAPSGLSPSTTSGGWERVDAPDSPSTLPSSPPPRTPVAFAHTGGGQVRVSNPERQRGSVVLIDHGVQPLEPPAPPKKVVRKITPAPPIRHAEDTSDSAAPQVAAPARIPRVRTKRYTQRPPNLLVSDPGDEFMTSVVDHRTPKPSPSPNSLVTPDLSLDSDMAATPRAADFPSMSPQERTHGVARKLSDGQETRVRKVSKDSQTARPRKISTDGHHRRTESAADEGDDEGYDELLSAYESEEGSQTHD